MGAKVAIGVKVDPSVIVAGQVVQVSERMTFLSDEDKQAGVKPQLERYDVTLFQDSGSQIQLRFPLAGLEPPAVGTYVAVEARVSEAFFNGQNYTSLVVLRPAFDALDLIQSKLSNGA